LCQPTGARTAVIERSEQLLDLKDLSVDRAEHVGGDVWKLFLDLQASEGLAQLPGADLVVQHAREIGRAAAFGKPIEINGTAPMPSLAAPRLAEQRQDPITSWLAVHCSRRQPLAPQLAAWWRAAQFLVHARLRPRRRQ
jgi:hypothetical protein